MFKVVQTIQEDEYEDGEGNIVRVFSVPNRIIDRHFGTDEEGYGCYEFGTFVEPDPALLQYLDDVDPIPEWPSACIGSKGITMIPTAQEESDVPVLGEDANLQADLLVEWFAYLLTSYAIEEFNITKRTFLSLYESIPGHFSLENGELKLMGVRIIGKEDMEDYNIRFHYTGE